MARLVRAQVVIPKDSGLPIDAITNTFHFWNTGILGDTESQVQGALDQFYNSVVRNNYSVGKFLSKNLDGAGTRVKIYDLDNGEPVGPPIDDISLPITVDVSDSLPDEVACCLSYQAEPAAGIKQSRRRGRVYLGPFGVLAAAQNLGRSHVDDFMGQLIADAGYRLIHRDMGGVKWVVFSAKDYVDGDGVVHHKKPPQANDEIYEVDNCWVDNAWDTVRSRGPKASTRFIGSAGA